MDRMYCKYVTVLVPRQFYSTLSVLYAVGQSNKMNKSLDGPHQQNVTHVPRSEVTLPTATGHDRDETK